MHKQHMARLDNQRWEAFARSLAKGRSAAESYRKAGYEDDTGNASKLTANHSIQARVTELQQAAARRAEVSVEFVLTNAKELLARCLQKTPVMERDEEGNMVPSGEWKFDASGAAKALDMIAKHLAMYDRTVKVEHSGTVTTQTVDLAGLSPEKFAQLRDIVQEAQTKKRAD